MPANRLRSVLVLVSSGLAAACGQAPVVIDTTDSFSVDSPYQRKVAASAATACEGARRVLLGDGYVITSAGADTIKGRKAYRSSGYRSTFIEMDVVCVRDPTGSTLYASGLLSTFDVKMSAAAASVGVSAFGSVSLPIGQSADSMVKISDETISDRDFYRRFFVAVNAVLAGMPPEQTPLSAGVDAGRGATADVQPEAPTAEPLPQQAPPQTASFPAPPSAERGPQQDGSSQPPAQEPQQTALPMPPSGEGDPQHDAQVGSSQPPAQEQEPQQTALLPAPPSGGQDPRQDVQDGSPQPLAQESRQDESQAANP